MDDSSADVLVIFNPGIERFDYFRLGDRIRRGAADPAEILATQQRFDNHFVDSPVWRQARGVDVRPLLNTAKHRAEFPSSNVFGPGLKKAPGRKAERQGLSRTSRHRVRW
ncbi:hypothetical protein [Nocardia miyunensis]|uniref:hypothetical protein n=1 Tax=Nocardia miyunensis TaxID=282684 RepID=UPI00082A4564|nr:hypothetical protein [Nocardia miyunensis]